MNQLIKPKYIVKNKVLFFFITGAFVFIQQSVFSQQVDDKTKIIIEQYLTRDTANKSNLELVTKKTYFINHFESIKYKEKPYTIYTFGSSATHSYWYNFLFIDNSSNDFFIVGDNEDGLKNLIKLNEVLDQVSLLSDKNKCLLYKLLIENYEPRNKGKTINRK
jgi:hypothetical protein